MNYYDNAVDLTPEEGKAILATAPIRVRNEVKKAGTFGFTKDLHHTEGDVFYNDKWLHLCRTDLYDDVCTGEYRTRTIEEYRAHFMKKIRLGVRVGPDRFAAIDACTDG